MATVAAAPGLGSPARPQPRGFDSAPRLPPSPRQEQPQARGTEGAGPAKAAGDRRHRLHTGRWSHGGASSPLGSRADLAQAMPHLPRPRLSPQRPKDGTTYTSGQTPAAGSSSGHLGTRPPSPYGHVSLRPHGGPTLPGLVQGATRDRGVWGALAASPLETAEAGVLL